MSKLDEKFLLLDFETDKGNTKKPLYILNKAYYGAFKNCNAVIGDYFIDNRCGYVSFEMSNGFLIYLFHVPKSIANIITQREIIIKSFQEDEGSYWLHQKDELNIFKHLIVDSKLSVDASKNIHLLNFPLLFPNNPVIITRKIYLEKKVYSQNEMIYWSNVCLKMFNAFQNNLISRQHKLLNLGGTQFISHNLYQFEILDEIRKISSGSSVYFLIDACLSYDLKKLEIIKELNLTFASYIRQK